MTISPPAPPSTPTPGPDAPPVAVPDAPPATGAPAPRRTDAGRGFGGIGSDRARVDGPAKVTGTAPYAYEQEVENPAYLFGVTSTIAVGRIVDIDTTQAERVPGVLLVLTHRNAPRLRTKLMGELVVLQSDRVRHRGEYIGAVVAQTPEAAREAAALVRVRYDDEGGDVDFHADHPAATVPKRGAAGNPREEKGDVEAGLAGAAHLVDATYTTATEFHSPMEPHPITALWHPRPGLDPRARRLTIYEADQGPIATQLILAPMLGLLPNQIEIHSPFVGGAFGGKGMPHAHVMLVVLAAKLLAGRPVKFALTRQQMFATVGYRPPTAQRLRLAADADGRLTAVVHESVSPTAKLATFVEQAVGITRVMYATPNRRTEQRVVPLDIAPGTFMRAPGEFSGAFALETAMDELAVATGLDPIELRRRNEPDVDPDTGKPWSTRNLLACLDTGADRFGWEVRTGRPGERRDGEWLLGMGVAAASFPASHALSTWARITFAGGRYVVELQASDLGTGAWTILPQIAADALEVPVDLVDARIGSTGLPVAMIAGGSMGTYTWGNSIIAAARAFRRKHGPLPADGATARAQGRLPSGARQFARHSFGAHFAEVAVSEVTGEVRVRRMLGVFACGRIVNPRTARSQFVGGMTMGLSAALHEAGHRDPRTGHVVNHDLAGYHIAAHADVLDLDADWVEEFDPYVSPTGAKGIGEVGIVGVPAAIGNAIYDATGRRVRDLPFTPDKLVG